MVPPWILVAAFFGVAVFRSHQVGIWYRDPNGDFFLGRILISLAILVGCAMVDAVIRAVAQGLGVRATAAVLRERWTVRRLVLVVTGIVAYHLIYLTYHNLKSWDSFLTPRDAMLHRVDRWIFFGHTPAVLLHHLLGTGIADHVLVAIYESFSGVIMVAVIAFLALAPRERDAYVALCSMACIWVLGVATYYAIPTLGPFWVDPHAFASLPHTMVTSTQAHYVAQRAFLRAHPQDPHAFAQISAFASLHVGVTTVAVLLLRHFGFRRLFRIGVFFDVAVMVATVYLGWHFFVDDVAGVVIALLAVRFGRWMAHPRGGEPAPAERAWRFGRTSGRDLRTAVSGRPRPL